VKVSVYVGVNVIVGVGVLVHAAAMAVWAEAVWAAISSGEGAHAASVSRTIQIASKSRRFIRVLL